MGEIRKTHPLRAARKERGRTLEWVAFHAGVSVKVVERIERGQAEPRRATKRVLADALGLQVEDIWPEQELAA